MWNFLSEPSMLPLVLFTVFSLAVAYQIFHILYFHVRIALWKHQPLDEAIVPCSVVICVRNEEKHLMELIPQLMEQDHPDFELVVVNDNSWDDSKDILKALQIQYPRIHVIELDEEKQLMQGKKFALTLGIKGAKKDIIVLTDADCRPSSNSWLRSISGPLAEERSELVLGFSPYGYSPGLLNALIRFDAYFIGLNYLGMAAAGNAYMGVGRNMAYSKSLFFDVGGFKSHYHIASGDDDLFVQEAAPRAKCTIQFAPESQAVSAPKTDFSSWFKQKKRHLTTSGHYRFIHKFFLAMWPLSFTLMWACGVLLMVLHNAFLIAGIMLLLRYLIQLVTFKVSMDKMGQSSLFWASPVLEALLWITNPIIWLSNLVSKPKTWT
jgi:cellulose synthase/poly-beta-1,6-N-acetylglucosamine synthase-like glycosyltransferase